MVVSLLVVVVVVVAVGVDVEAVGTAVTVVVVVVVVAWREDEPGVVTIDVTLTTGVGCFVDPDEAADNKAVTDGVGTVLVGTGGAFVILG